ncbi:MAG: hypothetical protein LBG84_05445 [Treponema sp.]|jgi:membrane-bound ClpP family serine protease|nr:hypothetical protein [Treponema sp.]
MSVKTGIRNFFCFPLILIGFILSLLGAMGTVKESDKTTYIILLAAGVVLFAAGVLLSKYKKNGTPKIILGFFAGILVVTLIIGAIVPTEAEKRQKEIENAEAWKTKDDPVMAEIMTRDFVKKRLKSPATAKFASAAEKPGPIVEKKEDHIYFVKSYVDSQNSLGAIIRTHYHGEIQQISKNDWRLISLEFED